MVNMVSGLISEAKLQNIPIVFKLVVTEVEAETSELD